MEFLTHSRAGTSTAYGMSGLVMPHGRRRVSAGLTLARLAISLWLFVSSLAGELHAQTQGSSLEYQVKAAFLLNFTRFVAWPTAAFAVPDDPITICVIGQDPFGTILDRTIEGESVNNHGIRALRLLPDDDLHSCQILFISRSEQDRFAQIVSRLRGYSVLTVSELRGFADAGGMIEFIVEEGKARFYINASTAEAVGLKLSSRLLQVAKEVRGS